MTKSDQKVNNQLTAPPIAPFIDGKVIKSDQEVNQSQSRILVQLVPLDLLLFREARPFEAASNVVSGFPTPQTVAGALRTAMLNFAGISFKQLGIAIKSGSSFQDAVQTAVSESSRKSEDASKLGESIGSIRFRGPWFGLGVEKSEMDILFPLPATLKKIKGKDVPVRLDPLEEEIPGWEPEVQGLKPLWIRSKEKLESGKYFLTVDGMIEFLNGNAPSYFVPETEVFGYDDRTGISIDYKTHAVKESMIYSVRMLALKKNACLIAEISGASEFLNEMFQKEHIIPLGGEGRFVKLNKISENSELVNKMRAMGKTSPQNSNFDGRLIVLTTPAILNGWHPENLSPLAAAVPKYEAHSGWELAKNGPKPNRFAVPAGTVYYLKPEDEFSSASDQNLGDFSELGWGSFVEGKWSYA